MWSEGTFVWAAYTVSILPFRSLCNRKKNHTLTLLWSERILVAAVYICIGHFSCAIRTLCNGEEYFVSCTAANAKLRFFFPWYERIVYSMHVVNIFGVMLSYRDWSEPHGRFERTVTALFHSSANMWRKFVLCVLAMDKEMKLCGSVRTVMQDFTRLFWGLPHNKTSRTTYLVSMCFQCYVCENLNFQPLFFNYFLHINEIHLQKG